MQHFHSAPYAQTGYSEPAYVRAQDSRRAEAWLSGARVAALPMDQVIHAARSGDSSAFDQLVEQYWAAAIRVAQQILRTEDGAADAVQEAVIKAHRAMHRFQDGNFRSWLLRIVTNTCYDHLRRQKRRNSVSLDELTEEHHLDLPLQSTPLMGEVAADPEQVAVQNETMQMLLDTIDELPAWHRNVILLVDVHGYDYGEAAELLRVPLGTVKSRLSRARSALRDRLTERGVVRQPAH